MHIVFHFNEYNDWKERWQNIWKIRSPKRPNPHDQQNLNGLATGALIIVPDTTFLPWDSDSELSLFYQHNKDHKDILKSRPQFSAVWGCNKSSDLIIVLQITQSNINLVLSRELRVLVYPSLSSQVLCKFLDHLLPNRGVTKSIKFVSPERMSIKDVVKKQWHRVR